MNQVTLNVLDFNWSCFADGSPRSPAMGLLNKDSTGKTAAYHAGLPMKVSEASLRVGRDYAATQKPRGAPPTQRPEQPLTNNKPTEQQASVSAAKHSPPPAVLTLPPGPPLRTSPQVLPTTITEDEDSNSGLAPLPLTMRNPSRESESGSGSPTSTSTLVSPSQLKILPPPFLHPQCRRQLKPDFASLPTSPVSSTVTMTTNMLPNMAIPETGQTSDEAETLITNSLKTAYNSTPIPKKTRKQSMLTFGEEFSTQSAQSQERLLMRPWLFERLELGDISGMVWIDKPNNLFQIPWKHGSRREWEHDTDAKLFRMWAQHTGKYRPGHPGSVTDPKTWKANFRCAINSLPDVIEVKEMNAKSKRGPNAFKVYTFLPAKSRKRGSSKDSKRTIHIKKEQEIRDIIYDRAPRQPPQHSTDLDSVRGYIKPEDPRISPGRASPPAPLNLSKTPPKVSPPSTMIAEAIQSLVEQNKMEEDRIGSNKEYHSEASVNGELDHRDKLAENFTSNIKSSSRSTPVPGIFPAIHSAPYRPNIPNSTASTMNYSESHIPHKKRKIKNIDFLDSKPISVHNSNVNSLLNILSSTDNLVAKRSETKELKNKVQVSDSNEGVIGVIRNYSGDCYSFKNIASSRSQIEGAELDQDLNVRRIPTVVLENSEAETDSAYDSLTRESSPEQEEMNVDVLLQTIPRRENEIFALNQHGIRCYPTASQPIVTNSFGCKIHKNKEFLKRFLKDDNVRTLIKTKLDEIHRCPAYEAVLKGQQYIAGTSIEGPLGQKITLHVP